MFTIALFRRAIAAATACVMNQDSVTFRLITLSNNSGVTRQPRPFDQRSGVVDQEIDLPRIWRQPGKKLLNALNVSSPP
jgi:hypothetical protein